jgi:predicted nucleotidyltransferase
MKRKPSTIKPIEISDEKKIVYTNDHWKLLSKLRLLANKIMSGLEKQNIKSLVYGSITRGDVSQSSDIDLFIPYQISSFQLELALEQAEFDIYGKKIVQATPKHLVKGHIMLSEDITITFPLTSIREREFDFIHFGGSLTLEELDNNKRVPGVDKRLILISPTETGHIETPVIGFESVVAKKVGVSVELVKERVRILTARDKTGRTGVYLDLELALEENFDEVFKRLCDNDPIIRRRAQLKKK